MIKSINYSFGVSNSTVFSSSHYNKNHNEKFNNEVKYDTVTFTSKKTDIAKSIANNAFLQVAKVRKGKLGTFLGTTNEGINVTIQEEHFGKSLKLFLQNALKNPSFEVFQVIRSSVQSPKVLNERGKEVKSIEKLSKIASYLDDLK